MHQHLNKYAYNKGFSAFLSMDFNNPFPVNSLSNKEWERGQDAAYCMFLKRSKTREANRQNRST